MRCLYCGKELALFKRLRGGEFCSDAHRQSYQNEYTQLALNRLLQAKTGESAETGAVPAPATPKSPESPKAKDRPLFGRPMENLESPALRRRESQVRPEPPLAAASAAPAPPSRVSSMKAPVMVTPPPQPKIESAIPVRPVQEEVKVPPARVTGIRLALPVPVMRATPLFTASENTRTSSFSPSLPRLRGAAYEAGTGPTLATRVSAEPPERADFQPAPREGALEVRDFVRSGPFTEIDLRPDADTGLGVSREPLTISVDFHSPRKDARLLQEDPCAFLTPPVMLGDLARLDFAVTDWEEPDAAAEATMPAAPPEPAAPEPVSREPVRMAQPKPAAMEPPRRVEPVHIEPVFIEKIAAVAPPPVPAQVSQPKPAPAPQPAPPPDAVTKPVPVTLHGLAPAAGRPAQVFSAPLIRTGEIQAPRQNSLPLRPVIVITAAAAAEAKAPAEKPAAKPEPRPAPEKPRKSDRSMLSLHLKEEVKPQAAKPEKPAAKPREPQKVSTPPVAPAPPAMEPDLLGLPKLSLETSTSFWSRLSVAARIGITAAILAAVAGGIFLTSRGSSATRNRGPILPASAVLVEAGPALAADAGWITDWFSDNRNGAPSRHVDLMRGSMTLRDYRVELEGQIDQGGLGWVFRGNNRKAFYVEKLQIVKPGLEPDFALVRFAMIDGKEESRQQIPLPLKAHLDTFFKIRLDAVGHKFTTYVQNQQVDQWTDDRIEVGGAGLYYDPGDIVRLKGTLHVVPLKEK